MFIPLSTAAVCGELNDFEQDDLFEMLEQAIEYDMLVCPLGEDVESDTNAKGESMPDGELDRYTAYRGCCVLRPDDVTCYQNGGGELPFRDPKELKELLFKDIDRNDPPF